MYIIQEYQTDENNVTEIATPVTKAEEDAALGAFYQACSYAAVSKVPIHTVCLTNEIGVDIDHKVFRHREQAEQLRKDSGGTSA